MTGLLSKPLGHLVACLLLLGLGHAWVYKRLFVPVAVPGSPAEYSALRKNLPEEKLYLMYKYADSPAVTAA